MIRKKPIIPKNEHTRYYGRTRDLKPMDVNLDLNWGDKENDGTSFKYTQ